MSDKESVEELPSHITKDLPHTMTQHKHLQLLLQQRYLNQATNSEPKAHRYTEPTANSNNLLQAGPDRMVSLYLMFWGVYFCNNLLQVQFEVLKVLSVVITMYMYQILQAGLERMESVHAGFRFGMTKKYSCTCIGYMSNTVLFEKNLRYFGAHILGPKTA